MFKSKAQRERLKELTKAGKFPKEKFDQMEALYQRERAKGKDPLVDRVSEKPRGLVRAPRRDG